MNISIACDHGGIELKNQLVQFLRNKEFIVTDHGTHDILSVDYPPFAALVAADVLNKRADFGILICGTGLGMSYAANRFKGIRAALVHCEDYARLAREHNDANILVLGGRFISFEQAALFTEIFFTTPFEGGRHKRRVDALDSL